MLKMRVLVLAVACLVFSPSAMAQQKDWKSWYGHAAIGYSSPEGAAGDALDGGWNINAGAAYNPDDWPVGLFAELGFNTFDVNRRTTETLEATDGDVDIWSLTGGFLWTTRNEGLVNFYTEGGIGWYLIDVTLTDPALALVPGFCGWYWCVPPGVVETDAIVGSDSTIRFGYNAGIGLAFTVGKGSQIYLEAKYHWAQTTNKTTEYLPIVLGFRW